MSDFRYSVVIPTVGQRELALQAVESAWAQTAPPAEVIVVVDGDLDGTADAVLTAYPRSRVIVNPENKGQAASRNIGIEHATAPWVGFLDHDDLWHSRKQERIADYVATHPACQAVRCEFWMFRTPDVSTTGLFGLVPELVGSDRLALEDAATHARPVNDLSYLDIEGDSLRLMLERNRGTTTGTVIRRDLLDRIPRVPDGTTHGEDWLMFTHVAAETEWHLVRERLAFVRLHEGQATRAPTERAASDLVAVLSEMWDLYGDRPGVDLLDYRSEYGRLAQAWVWDLLRHGRVRSAIRTNRAFRRLLPARRDRLMTVVPPQVTWRLEAWRRGGPRSGGG